MILIWFLVGVAVFGALLFLLQPILPKGNLLQELATLPYYLWKVWQTPIDRMHISKHAFGSHRRQYLLLFEPLPGLKRQEAVVVYYHGGGWIFGSPEQFSSNAQFFVDQGYTVFMPSYRRPPLYAYREIDEDLTAALVKIRALMETIDLAGRPIILAGMSAGGHLVGLLLYDRRRLERLELTQAIFSGIIFFGAPLDLRKMPFSLPLYGLAGSRNSPTFDLANPAYHLQEKETTPVCWIHGDRDGMVPLKASASFIEQLEKVQQHGIRKNILTGGTHLDTGRWVFEEKELRQFVTEWFSSQRNPKEQLFVS